MVAFTTVQPLNRCIDTFAVTTGLLTAADSAADTAVLAIPHTVYALPAAATQAAVTDIAARTAVVVIGQEIRAGTVTGNRSRTAGIYIIRGVPALPHNARARAAYCTTAAAVFRVRHQVGYYPVTGDRLR